MIPRPLIHPPLELPEDLAIRQMVMQRLCASSIQTPTTLSRMLSGVPLVPPIPMAQRQHRPHLQAQLHPTVPVDLWMPASISAQLMPSQLASSLANVGALLWKSPSDFIHEKIS